MKVSDCVIRIAGEGGEGVISCGEILTQAIARTGHYVMSWKTFPSEIRGGLARFQFRVKSEPVPSLGSSVDVVVAFNGEGMDDCCKDASCQAKVVIYDPDVITEFGCESVPGARYAIPLNAICKETTGALRAKNVVAVGVVARLLNLDLDVCRQLITQTWQKKGDEVVDMNHRAVEAGYKYAKEKIAPENLIEIPARDLGDKRLLLVSGNDAIALGAIAAECNFVAGYPITPATSIFEYLCRHLPQFDGKTIQTEDEIAALATCIGASFAGSKPMTPTSGPGLCLMSELINLASMLELPVVIVDVQRGGPSTGLPTKTEQSDLNMAVYGTSGEAPRIVIAPHSVEDCYYQTIRAFNFAEQYQMPVFILSDASLAFRKMTIVEPDIDDIELVEREIADAETIEKGYLPFADTESGVSPMVVPGTPGAAHIVSSLEHVESGAPNYTPEIHSKMMEKRFRKLDTFLKNQNEDDEFMDLVPDAKVGIIGWGSTFGAICEARERLRKNNVAVSHFQPRILWPLNKNLFRRFVEPLEKVIVFEENFTGQFAQILRSQLKIDPIEATKCEGVPFTFDEIYNIVMEITNSERKSATVSAAGL